MVSQQGQTPVIPEETHEPQATKNPSIWDRIRHGLGSIQYTIIVPYLLLTGVIGVVGIYIVTSLIASTIQDRFTSQLLETSRVASDGVVRQERRQLEVLRPMTGTIGMAEAIQARDTATLRELLEVQAYNANLDSVMVLDAAGQLILRLEAIRTTNLEIVDSYQFSSGGDYANLPIIAPILAGIVDQRGDKYAGLVDSPLGPILYTSTPVNLLTDSGEVGPTVGVLMIGTRVDRILAHLKTEAFADHLVIYAPPGDPIGSTVPDWQQETQFNALRITPGLFDRALTTTSENPVADIVEVKLFQRNFRSAYAPMVIRGQAVGVIATLLSSNVVISTLSTSRDTIIAIFTIGIAMTVVIGLLIARRIVDPVSQLVTLSRAISTGDLTKRAIIQSENELGILGATFNEMIGKLESYTSALEEEVARTNAILESTADGVLVRDPEGKIMLANKAAKLMLTGDDGFDPMRLSLFQIPREQTDLAQRIELGPRTISLSMAKVTLPEGGYVGDVLVLRDVTREAMAERTKENFLNQITHELRTPLTAIRGYADVLRLGMDKVRPDMRERAIETIFHSSHVLSQMIDQIVDLTAMQSGSMVLYSERMNLQNLVEAILEEWAEPLREHNVVSVFNVRNKNMIIMADARRIRRAVDAVIQNAYDFSPEGGELKVVLKKEGNQASLSISDNGVGISEDDLPNVFHRFFRGSPHDKHGNLIDVRGMGQGLYVVRTIAEAHGGSVRLESKENKGTTVTIYLPLIEKDA
jgi:signal transduction histidine kinase